MKRDMREMIGINKYCIVPPYFLVYSIFVHDTYCMFSIFTLAIKFDCLLLTIFQSFDLFVGFIFDELAPPPPLNICFKRCFKSLFSPLQCIKQSQKC